MSKLDDNLSNVNKIDLPITSMQQANASLRAKEQEVIESRRSGGAMAYPMMSEDEYRIRDSAINHFGGRRGASTFCKGDSTARK